MQVPEGMAQLVREAIRTWPATLRLCLIVIVVAAAVALVHVVDRTALLFLTR